MPHLSLEPGAATTSLLAEQCIEEPLSLQVFSPKPVTLTHHHHRRRRHHHDHHHNPHHFIIMNIIVLVAIDLWLRPRQRGLLRTL